jgi:hypothetical protein
MISVGLHNLPDEVYSGSRVRDYEVYGEDFGVGIYLNEWSYIYIDAGDSHVAR